MPTTAATPYFHQPSVEPISTAMRGRPLGSTAARLAKMAGLSLRQFGRKFRSTFQSTPRDYLMRMRILHACSLLAETSLPVTDVALQSGFYDHSDFARQFRRQLGQSASEYRSTHQNRSN